MRDASAGITAAVVGSALILTLNRPDKGNALRQQECAALLGEIRAVDGGGDVRAILIRAEGRNFCAGADLVSANADQGKPRTGHLTRSLEAGAHGLISAVWNCPVPTISAVQGKAIGLGLHLAVVCDFVVAATDAAFVEPFCKRGFSVDSGGSFLLPRLVGLRRARQMLFRGTAIDAATAVEWGLIDAAVAPDALEQVAEELATELASGPTYSLGHTKKLLNNPASGGLDAALSQETKSVEATVRSADFKEGLRAFVERREPDFTGN
ncbi:enoyl-CoA hydratase/isomerase family protein [Mycobacterium paraseoulense]|uniref:Enoyl-CoA hydratase n=1 Tax=Mycobacterium paraseoulense TaxID=590652 RepID=A0A1X0IF42_9MYCO|nr:enoyl-CoA hydratase-related protein [Mycobacterium paraseoulense]MCV7393723.1 enoyl-CoA hydratase/isomerase family protein [Mycobacterium paraseoulense]ORB45526.1 enoyl-CoA hydratase [Mycobacterium paraseoulense]BBZ70659.1 enoyl-CoA hydratase [Mycobacterium paraseoulense]